MNKNVDISEWTRDYSDNRHPFWWGILILITIETAVISGFIISYFYLWMINVTKYNLSWPPEGTSALALLNPTLYTLLIGLCAFSMLLSRKILKNGKKHFFSSLIFCCLTGFLALSLRWLQLTSFDFSWKDNAYASIIWTLTGFHFLHLTSAILATIVVAWFAFKGYYNSNRRLGVEVVTMYWYFIFLGWLPVYFVIYLMPKIL